MSGKEKTRGFRKYNILPVDLAAKSGMTWAICCQGGDLVRR